MKYNYLNGKVGKLEGTFEPNVEIIDLIGQKEKLQDFKGLIKLGIQAKPGDLIEINNYVIKIGVTGIYELDIVLINSLKFKQETKAIVDYVF